MTTVLHIHTMTRLIGAERQEEIEVGLEEDMDRGQTIETIDRRVFPETPVQMLKWMLAWARGITESTDRSIDMTLVNTDQTTVTTGRTTESIDEAIESTPRREIKTTDPTMSVLEPITEITEVILELRCMTLGTIDH